MSKLKTLKSLMVSPTGSGRPPQEIIDRGIQDGEMFEDMYAEFLQTYLEQMEEMIGGFMFRYYGYPTEWEGYCQNVDDLKSRKVVDISDSEYFDDCVIIGKLNDSYYYFWKHNSGHMDIGRCHVNSVESDAEFISIVKQWVENLLSDVLGIFSMDESSIKEIPKEYFYKSENLTKSDLKSVFVL